MYKVDIKRFIVTCYVRNVCVTDSYGYTFLFCFSSYNPVLSSLITYHRIINMSNMTPTVQIVEEFRHCHGLIDIYIYNNYRTSDVLTIFIDNNNRTSDVLTIFIDSNNRTSDLLTIFIDNNNRTSDVLNHGSAETLTTGWMIHSGTNSLETVVIDPVIITKSRYQEFHRYMLRTECLCHRWLRIYIFI
jgi:hypothetical protein